MADHQDDKQTSSEASAGGAPQNDLPTVESPSLSPAADESASTPTTALIPFVAPTAEEKAEAPAASATAQARFRFRPRQKRQALLAASVAIGVGLGAIIGALATGGLPASPRADVASIEERKAMQQSIAHLSKQVATLKANLDQAEKSTRSQVAKITERLDRQPREDITGSIPKPAQPGKHAEVPAKAAEAAPVLDQVGLPAIPRVAAAASKPSVVPDWFVRSANGGYVYVESHGEIYQVVPGARLPGLGLVQNVEREQGRWVVVTPKGIIVSARDRSRYE